MKDLDPRIRTALISIDPTTKNPAWHGVPTAIGVLRGDYATMESRFDFLGLDLVLLIVGVGLMAWQVRQTQRYGEGTR